MKNILIITYYYKHKNAMASVRSIKLAKYFAKQGHKVTVLTSNQIDTWTKNYNQPVADENITEIYAPQVRRWTLIRKYLAHRKKVGTQKAQTTRTVPVVTASTTNKRSLKQKVISYVKWLFYFNLAKQEDICMFKGLKAEYVRGHMPKYDTVIATYPTYGAFLMGMWMKRHRKCEQFIADFRDPLYNPGFRNHKQEAAYDSKCLHRVVRYADQIICVSKGIADGIRQEVKDCRTPIDIITNGFDPDDVLQNDEDVQFDKNKINFVYTGTLYHGKRCVNMLASVLRELIDERKILPDSFQFQYAGPDYGELCAQLSEYELEMTAQDYGFVSREKSIAMQKNADALLLLTWNETDYQGVVPGKLFEYMAIEGIPILALITGNVKNSEVAMFIRETETGCACEMASAEDMFLLKEYVQKLFAREVQYAGNAKKYNYATISTKYLEYM